MAKAIDLTGQRFGRLVATGERRLIGNVLKWRCQCDCGGVKWTRSHSLRIGKAQSCGCAQREATAAHNRAAKTKSGIAGQFTYEHVHRRVKRVRGSASKQKCVDCGEPAYDWSYDGLDPDERFGAVRGGYLLPYSNSISHYVARCRTCHRRHDLPRSKQRKEMTR